MVICLQQRVFPVKCGHIWAIRLQFVSSGARRKLLYYVAMQLDIRPRVSWTVSGREEEEAHFVQ